jgi:hypothetical protein
MNEIMDVHPVTIIVVIGIVMATPLNVFATYVFSGASRQKGLRIAIATMVFGARMFWVCVSIFLSALFFGFTSSASSLQLFHPAVPNHVIAFPTGIIPLVLVPYATLFHVLSALNYTMHERGKRDE